MPSMLPKRSSLNYLPIVHCCPVCRMWHWVHPLRHQLAYGKTLACSVACRASAIRRLRADLREQVIPAYLPVKYFQLPKHCLTRVQPCL